MNTQYCVSEYCGRVVEFNNSLGECGACPRGYHANISSICVECSEHLQFYDWLYLSFMALVFIVIQFYFIDRIIRSNNFLSLALWLYMITVAEAVLSSIITLFIFNNDWSFDLKTCGDRNFSDWYTLFYNPSGTEEYKCTQEAVYPIYSIVFLFYIVVLVFVLLRPLYYNLTLFCIYLLTSANIIKKLSKKGSNYPRDCMLKITYYILYSIPAVIFLHTLLAGIIYNIFPYLLIIGSIISIAHHLSKNLNQHWFFLLCSIIDFRNFAVIIFHWLLLAFGIVSLTQLRTPDHYFLLCAVPVPTFFYIFTSKFTDPINLI